MIHLNFNPFPVLKTNRLLLRQLGPDDAPSVRILRSDKSVNEFIDRQGAISLEEAQNFIEKIEKGISQNESLYWAICLKEDEILIGTACLWNISVEKDMAELGYELLPKYQSQGLMLEAIESVIHFSFEQLKLKVITALPKPENKKSIQLLLKKNFRLDLKEEFICREEANGYSVYYLKKE